MADSPVDLEDIAAAPAPRRAWLTERLGRPVCSVLAEATAAKISTDELEEGFEPSMPFVACMSAAMVVAEIVKDGCGLPSPLEPRFQMDLLRGPAQGCLLPQRRRPDCLCVTRGKNIQRSRDGRAPFSLKHL